MYEFIYFLSAILLYFIGKFIWYQTFHKKRKWGPAPSLDLSKYMVDKVTVIYVLTKQETLLCSTYIDNKTNYGKCQLVRYLCQLCPKVEQHIMKEERVDVDTRNPLRYNIYTTRKVPVVFGKEVS